jgi:hypothetical protein
MTTDWKVRFQELSKGTAAFGTAFGSYTIAELADLLASKDKEIAVLADDLKNHLPAWVASDPMAANQWQSDFIHLQTDYGAACGAAQAAIADAHTMSKNLLTPDSLNTTGDTPYRMILAAINPKWESHDASADRILNLRQRLSAAGAKMSSYAVPQPRKSSDFDLNVFQTTDKAARNLEDAAHKAARNLEDAAHKAFQWSQPVVIAAVVTAGLVGLLALKSYLPPAH